MKSQSSAHSFARCRLSCIRAGSLRAAAITRESSGGVSASGCDPQARQTELARERVAALGLGSVRDDRAHAARGDWACQLGRCETRMERQQHAAAHLRGVQEQRDSRAARREHGDRLARRETPLRSSARAISLAPRS